MENLSFEELYEAYNLCLKNKKRKMGTYNFVNFDLCKNLFELLEELNNHTYIPQSSNCYVITDPALREIYAAQFRDRIVQHFYMKEIENILEEKFVIGCSSCIKERGTDYALKLLRNYLEEISNKGKQDCFFLKIDLSGYFMSIDRKQISDKFEKIIREDYKGKHKELLLYLTPVIFENNPARNCKYKCDEKLRMKVPERRKMDSESDYGMAIGNLTAQAASNLNLNDFDNYVVNNLKLDKYIRYVDDIVIISENKNQLINVLPSICKMLENTHQSISKKKTKIDTAYYGVPFLGKISYPYGYQKPSKQVIIRTYKKSEEIKYDSNESLLAKVNSQIGSLKNYNCKKLIINYANKLPKETNKIVDFNEIEYIFKMKNNNC
ncbi:MAG: RNA-directed DNA polymerase [Clostridia bacterium]|nr:RNA-directed DNA polymerase [Clostridia bacterium]